MKKFLSVVLVGLAIYAGLFLAKAIVRYGAEQSIQRGTMSTERSTEPTYMGITKTEYLNIASNNGQDKGAECAYTYLIDTYGIEATYKMDKRADKDPDDVDPAIYEAIERCI